MKTNYFKSKRRLGVTLIELVLALALVSLVIALSYNFLFLGKKVHSKTIDQYNLQSAFRITTEKINETIRYSKAVFAVPETFIENKTVMDPEWNYLMVYDEGKTIVNMKYDEDSGEHKEEILVSEKEGISYKIIFEKDDDSKNDTLMKYAIYAYVIDEEGNEVRDNLVFESTAEAVNSVQVVDKGTELYPAVALAYRVEGQTSGMGKISKAFVSIVVDTSGSMNDPVGGVSKIDRVRTALTGSGAEEGIIQQFSKENNIFVSVVPFSKTANYPNPEVNSEDNPRSDIEPGDDFKHPIYEVYVDTAETELISRIKNVGDVKGKLNAGGGTNTGDGLRRAYYLHNEFRDRVIIDEETQVKHYMIVLVDGQTTYEVFDATWEDNGRYYSGLFSSNYDWRTNWNSRKHSTAYIGKGSINIIKPEDLEKDYYLREQTGSIFGNPIYRYYNGRKNNDVESYAITGDGRLTITNSPYVTAIGNLIKAFDSGNGIKSYIIGYANNLGTHVNKIGTDIGTDDHNVYRYDDPDFNLDEVFKNIASDITADFRLITGPQIQN